MLEWSASRMLAAIRARPVATSADAGRCGFVAPLPPERGRARADEPLATAGDGGRRRLALPLGGELAAGSADLLSSIPPDRRPDPGVAQDRRESLDRGVVARDPRRVGDRVHRDEVDVGVV